MIVARPVLENRRQSELLPPLRRRPSAKPPALHLEGIPHPEGAPTDAHVTDEIVGEMKFFHLTLGERFKSGPCRFPTILLAFLTGGSRAHFSDTNQTKAEQSYLARARYAS